MSTLSMVLLTLTGALDRRGRMTALPPSGRDDSAAAVTGSGSLGPANTGAVLSGATPDMAPVVLHRFGLGLRDDRRVYVDDSGTGARVGRGTADAATPNGIGPADVSAE